MKKKIISVLMSALFIFTLMQVLTSCADETNGADDLVTKNSTQNVETNDPGENNESETDSKSVGSSEIIDTSEPTPDKTPENAAVTINTDLLNEYMMTYGELTEKYGKVVKYFMPEGGSHYMFENSPVYYFFHINNNLDNLVTDQESGLKYMPIDDDELCRGIRDITPELLFNGTFETLSIEDISNMEGINFVRTLKGDIDPTVTIFSSTFTYDGWNSDKVMLYIRHENENMIDLTSEARIFIHPLNIDAEEAQADVTINTDLLNEYMMTYGELTEKYGKLVKYNLFDGGSHYMFEKSPVYYFFYIYNNLDNLVTDQESGLKYMPIDDDELCRGIRDIPPELLFNGTFETLSIEDISNMEGINFVRTLKGDIDPTVTIFSSTFTYDGWNSDKVMLYINHKDENMIDLTSEAEIYIHPLNIDAEEAQAILK